MKTTNKRPLWVCPDCVQAIESHGEKIILGDRDYTPRLCDWCDDETEESVELWFKGE